MSDQGYGGTYGDPQYPSDPHGQYGGQYGSGYGEQQTGPFGMPPAGSKQRGIFLGLGGVVIAGLVVLILAIAGVFSSSGTTGDNPKQVVEKVLFASKKQNLDDVKAVVCKKDLDDPDLPKIVGDKHAVSYSIGSASEDSDDRVEVDIRITTSAATTSIKLPVVKEDGKWKACFAEVDFTGGGGDSTDPPPTDPPTTPPTDPPTTSSSVGFCGTQTVAADVAKTFISFITLSSTSLADDCVYPGRITSGQLEALTGDIYSPTQNEGQPGPRFVYKSAQGESTITLTVERQSDGKYYVTAASKS